MGEAHLVTVLLKKQANAQDGRKTGDGSSVGFFIPLSKELADKFPDLGENDRSVSHTTFMFVGTVPKDRQSEFLAVSAKVFEEIRGPVRGHLYGPDYFNQPDKDRRVAIMRVRFDHDLAGMRWKLRDALQDAGFEVDDYFPLVYSPHVTLAYLDGLQSEFKGVVPTGDWTFDGIEVWGLPEEALVEFGNPTRTASRVASKTVSAMQHQVSVDLMKFLSLTAKKLGVSEHVYVVGGAVRNFIIKEPIKDIDVVVDSVALGGKDSEWFAKQLQRTIPVETNLTTNNYGVAILTVKGDWEVGGQNLAGEVIEIANARTESYAEEGWKPEDVAPSTIEDDTFRREFTFNTLLWRLHDLAEGPDKAEILDLTGCGLKDLQEGMMRCPSDPDKTFSDDPSRMIRAIKFLLKYGFKISPEVEASIKRNREKIRKIPPGHLSNMLITLFFDTGVGKRALWEMDKLGLLEVIKTVAQDNKPFREALANWAERKAELSFLFDLMDMGMPTGKSLGFLNPAEKDRVREITVEMNAGEGSDFVAVLEQPGKVISMPKLIAEFGLKNAEIRTLMATARTVLLDDPPLAASGPHWEEAIRKSLAKQGKTAGIFEAPPAMVKAVEKWMLSVYCGHVLAGIERRLATFEDPLEPAKKVLAEMVKAARDLDSKIDRMEPGDTLKIQLHQVDPQGHPLTSWVGLRVEPDTYINSKGHTNHWYSYESKPMTIPEDGQRSFLFGEGKVKLVFPKFSMEALDAEGAKELIMTALGKSIEKMGKRVQYLQAMGGLDHDLGTGAKIVWLKEMRGICQQYTNQAKAVTSRAAKEFSVDVTDWKYLKPGSKIIDLVNVKNEETNVRLKQELQDAEEGFPLAKALYKAFLEKEKYIEQNGWDTWHGTPEEVAYAKARQELDVVNRKAKSLYWNAYRVEHEGPPTKNYVKLNPYSSDWVSVSEVKLKKHLGPDDVQGALHDDGWKSITCILDFKGHETRGGVWRGNARELQVDAKYTHPVKPEWLEEGIVWIRNTVRHELQHVGQDLLKKALQLKEDAGLPSKSIRSPDVTPDGYKQQEKYDPKRVDHALRDVEFHTRLADEVAEFVHFIKALKPEIGWRPYAQDWVLYRGVGSKVRVREFFSKLKDKQPDKWKKAVAEFFKAVDNQLGGFDVVPAKSKTAGLFQGPPAMLRDIENWMLSVYCGHVLALLDRHGVSWTIGDSIDYWKEMRKVCLQHTTKAQIQLRGVRNRFPVDVTGWKYVQDTETLTQEALGMVGWGVVTGTLDFTGRASYGGQWDRVKKQLDVVPWGVKPRDPEDLMLAINNIRSSLRHELQHMGQDMLKEVKQIHDLAGLPGKKLRTPGFDSSGISTNDTKRQDHALRDVEFYPRLTDEINTFVQNTLQQHKAGDPPLTPSVWMPIAQAWVLGQVPKQGGFFAKLKGSEPLKWKKATAEFIKAVAERLHPAKQSAKKVASLWMSRIAKTYTVNEGDPVLFGKYKNKHGIIRDFGTNEKGEPTITIESPTGKKQVVNLFKIREDKSAQPATEGVVSEDKEALAGHTPEYARLMNQASKTASIFDAPKATPKGQNPIVTQGPFEVTYLPKYEDLIPGLLDGLEKAENSFRKVGLPLRGVIPIRVKGKAFGNNRSFYMNLEGGFIQLVPQNLRSADNFRTIIHEIAHYWHNHFVPGGFGNGAIRSRFNEVWRTEDTGGSAYDRIQSQIALQKKKLQQIAKQALRAGATFEELGQEGWSGPKTYLRQYRVVRVEGQKVLCEILNPSEWDKSIRKEGPWYDTMPLHRVAQMVSSDYKEEYAVFMDLLNQSNEVANDPTKNNRYQDLSSIWVPTTYAKENHKEWFAELITTAVLDPNVLQPFVTDWLMSVAKTGNGPSNEASMASRVAAKFTGKKAQRTEWTDRYMPSVGETYSWTTWGGDQYQGTVTDTDSNVLQVACTDGTTRMVEAAKFTDKKKVKTQDGEDMTVYEYSEKHVENRHKEKAERIDKLRGSFDKLRTQYRKDLKSDDAKTRSTALAVGLMDVTYERVGNSTSAEEGHFGVTGWQKKHITFSGGKATIKYVGKSGVDHVKEVTDSAILTALKAATKGKKDNDKICEGEDCSVGASDVNAYLKPFDISAKDIRGFHANSEMQDRLKAVRSKGGKLPTDKKEREKKLKAEFKEALEGTAEAVGHESATLRSQYLVPGLEDEYLKDGKVSESFKKKGMVRQASIQTVRELRATGAIGEHYRMTCPKCACVTQCRCPSFVHAVERPVVGSALCLTCSGALTASFGVTANLAEQLEDKVEALIEAYAEGISKGSPVTGVQPGEEFGAWVPSFRPSSDFGKWFLSKFRIKANLTPRGGKELKDKAEKFLWWAQHGMSSQQDAERGLQELRRVWTEFKPFVPDLVRLFSEEGTADVPPEIKTSHATYINKRGLPRKTLEAYVQSIDKIWAGIQGWRKKAMAGDFKVCFAGPDVFRGTASGMYRESEDILYVKAIPAIMKRAPGKYASPDYILVHELGHRYADKVGLRENFDRGEWYTTRYSRVESLAGSESFAELFALGHFGMNSVGGGDFTQTLEKFEAVMTGHGKAATKTHSENEDDQSERLVRPAPKDKPPRRDLHDEKVHEKDPDLDNGGADADRDLSLNYKKVAYLWVMGANKRQEKKNKKKQQQREEKAKPKGLSEPPKLPPLPKEPAKKEEPEHKPGEFWKTDEGFAANNPDGVTHAFEDEDAAKAYAKGQKEEAPKKDSGAEHKTQIEALTKALEDGKGSNINKAVSALNAIYESDPELAKHKPAMDKFVADIKKAKNDAAKASISLEMSTSKKDKKEFQKKQDEALKIHDEAMDGLRGLAEDHGSEETESKDGDPVANPEDLKHPEDKALNDAVKEDNGEDTEDEEAKAEREQQEKAEAERKKQHKRVDKAVSALSADNPALAEQIAAMAPEDKDRVAKDMADETAKLTEQYADDPHMAALEIGDSPKELSGHGPKQLGKQLAKAQYVNQVLANPLELMGHSVREDNKERSDEELVSAGKQSFKKFSGMPAHIRGEAAKRLAEELEKTPEGPRKQELLRVADGLYMASIIDGDGSEMIINGKPLGGPAPAPSFVAMARALHKNGKADLLMGTKADYYGQEGQAYVQAAMSGLSDEGLLDVVGAGPEMREALGDSNLNVKSKDVLRNFLRQQAANDMVVSHHILADQIKGSEALASAHDRIQEAVENDDTVKKTTKEMMSCLAKAEGDEKALKECRATQGKKVELARAKAELASMLKEVPGISPNHPQLRQLQRVVELGDPSEMSKIYRPTPVDPETKKRLEKLEKDDRAALEEFQKTQEEEDSAEDSEEGDFDEDEDFTPKTPKHKKSPTEQMQDFLRNAKPETIERLKDLNPDEFMKLLGALTGDSGKTAMLSSRSTGVSRRRLTWFL